MHRLEYLRLHMSTVFLPCVKKHTNIACETIRELTYLLSTQNVVPTLLWKTCKILQWYDKLPQDTLVGVAMQTILFRRWFFDVGNKIYSRVGTPFCYKWLRGKGR